MKTYAIFKPDSHYGHPKAELSEKLLIPYDDDDLLKFYSMGGYTAWGMRTEMPVPPDTVKDAFDDYGDSPCFHTIYIIDGQITEGEIQYVESYMGEYMGEFLSVNEESDPYARIISEKLNGINVVSINMKSFVLCEYGKEGGKELGEIELGDNVEYVANRMAEFIKDSPTYNNKLVSTISRSSPSLWRALEPKLGKGTEQAKTLGDLGF